ncbi:hypothetical protein [Rhodococcus qingshengii]|uniref:hypothetical protein n=1 Tax=Rhodococcus qingshengii TaxID=334542 RepID=UPI001BE4F749|nr:hypothetical protein [Rhodococcus qingshengii]MBT2274426.1 hypothetical protein [Rhodococcus qingshengii]
MRRPRRILGLPPGLTRPPAPTGASSGLKGGGVRLAPLGESLLEAVFLGVTRVEVPNTDRLYNERCGGVIPRR